MEIIIVADAAAVGAYAAERIATVVRAKPDAVIGVATGSSPLGTYAALAEQIESGLDVDGVSAFALDEYVGLPAGHPESYAAVIEQEVTKKLGLDPSKVHVPDASRDDLDAACADYERAMADAGGVDIQLLGVGSNGHIGFNEPTSSLASRTRVKTLAPRTREDNARFFDSIDDVPVHCLTQGLGTIMDARRVLLVATGESKADAIAGVVEGPVSAMCPGSVLQLHRFATIVVDEAAASKLTLADYYRHAAEYAPTVQGAARP